MLKQCKANIRIHELNLVGLQAEKQTVTFSLDESFPKDMLQEHPKMEKAPQSCSNSIQDDVFPQNVSSLHGNPPSKVSNPGFISYHPQEQRTSSVRTKF
jgi:hypothetical protein